jgi:hypothetical protein
MLSEIVFFYLIFRMLPLIAAQNTQVTLVLVVHFPTDLANLQVKFKVFFFFHSLILLENLAGLLSHHMSQ